MNKLSSSIIGGIAGALVLNVIHQAVKQFDHDAPRVDLVGEEAITKGMKKADLDPPTGDALFTATLVADVISNAAYYGLAGFAPKKHLVWAGTALGVLAGVGALTLTKAMGLSDAPVTRTVKTKALTVTWYTIGGYIAGAIMNELRTTRPPDKNL